MANQLTESINLTNLQTILKFNLKFPTHNDVETTDTLGYSNLLFCKNVSGVKETKFTPRSLAVLRCETNMET